MKHTQQQFNEDQLNDAVDQLRRGERVHAPHTPEVRTAQQIHALTADDRLDQELDDKMEHLLLQRFGESSAPQHDHNFADEKKSIWSKITLAMAPALAIGLAVIAFVVTPDNSPQTVADVQSLESLSQAEELLGTLPAGSQIDGIDVAQLRADIHAVNARRAEADLTLDPDAELFPHVQLRDAALDVINDERDIVREIESASVEVASVDTSINTFEGKALKWPTQNEGVSFDVHEKAVNGYKNHDEEWNRLVAELLERLLEQ